MKRIGYIFEDIISIDNLREAHYDVKRAKRPKRRKAAIAYEEHLEENLQRLHEALADESWNMHPYRRMVRIERGKRREIYYSPSHEDSIVQHAILRTLGKRIVKTFIRDTYASIKRRGTHDGVRRVRDFISKLSKDTACYSYKSDIHHFYQSIQHSPLIKAVWHKVKDSRAARLLVRIIESHNPGIPIGNALSPLFANMLLSSLDHIAKEIFRIRGYFRYLDDIVAAAKGVAKKAKEAMQKFAAYMREHLAGIGLKLKPNEQVFPIERGGIDFLGYVFKRTCITLRKKTERRLRRAVERYKRNPNAKNRATLSSYWGIVKWISQSNRFWYSFFDKPINQLEVLL